MHDLDPWDRGAGEPRRPSMHRITLTDLPSLRPSSAPSSSPPSRSRPAPARPGPATECHCHGAGYYVADVAYGHPDFGRLITCSCLAREQNLRRQLAHEQLLAALAGELGRLRGCALSNFRLDRELSPYRGDDGRPVPVNTQRAALAAAHAAAVAYAEEGAGWIYFHGPPGAGKSHLAAGIAAHLAAQGRAAIFASVPALLRHIKAGFGDGSADARLLALQEVELLVLDDLGAEQGTAWSETTLFEILNTRYLYERATIITSNLPPDALDGRLADRIAGQAIVVPMPISSRRRVP